MAAMKTIGAVSKETGIHPSSLRRYEERGFVTPQRLRVGGALVRVYSASDVELLKEVKGLVEAGYTVRAAFSEKQAEAVNPGTRRAPEPNGRGNTKKGGDRNA